MALELTLTHLSPVTAATDCLIVGLFSSPPTEAPAFSPAGQALDAACGGQLSALAGSGDISTKGGKTTLIHALPGISAARVLVVGLGERGKFGAADYIKAVSAAVDSLKTGPVKHALLTLSELEVTGRDAAWRIRQSVIAAEHAAYRYTATLGAENKTHKETGLSALTVLGSDQTALKQGQAIAKGITATRELGHLPPNLCNPAYLAEWAQGVAENFDQASCDVLDEAQMESLGMGSLLAVARGSANRPRLIVLKWNNGGNTKPYVLVGKGVTFDSGGVNLKTQGGIEEMKYDMCGAGSVLGAFVAAANLGLKINLISIVPAVENAIGGNSYRPSDVITSMSGKTIEVGNTDAEGRLVLCDALTYAERFEPQALIDVATLTGACMVALGRPATGLMSKHDDLAAELLAAGDHVDDRAWRLPLWDEYQSLLESRFADIYNIGGRWAGAITAGCFLSRFTEKQRWAHLDIAGSAMAEGKLTYATGRPVGLLAQWLLDRASGSEA